MSRRGRAAASRSTLRAALAVAGTLASLLIGASAATAAPFDPGASSIPSTAKVTVASPDVSSVVKDVTAGAPTAPAGPSAPDSAPAAALPSPQPPPQLEPVGAAVKSIADQAPTNPVTSDRLLDATPRSDTGDPAPPAAGLVESIGKLATSVTQRSPIGEATQPLRQSLVDDLAAPLLQQSAIGDVADALAPAFGVVHPLMPAIDAIEPPSGSVLPFAPIPTSLALPTEPTPTEPTIATTAPIRGVEASSPSSDGAASALAIGAIPNLDSWATTPLASAERTGTVVPVDGSTPAPGGPVGASGSASAGGFAPLPVLAALLLLALIAPILRSVPKEAPAFLRPAPYIALLERPG
jgi:hypothetical protein